MNQSAPTKTIGKLLLIFLICSPVLIFTQSPSTFFIMDGSGSMWAKMGEETKIQIAKRVLKNAVKNFSEDKNPGLVVYGHRVKSDCNDIELILTPETASYAEFSREIDAINPKGKTPLASSAMMVIDYIKQNPIAANIILITDGIETCDGNLCEVVRNAKEAGIDFVLHIVGFGLQGEDLQPLECAAQAGGGRYIDAGDENGLASALESVQDLSIDKIMPRLSIECVKDGELVDALIEIVNADTREEVTRTRSYSSEETNPALIGLPYGKFDAIISVIGSRGIPPISIKDLLIEVDTVRVEKVDFTSGRVSIAVVDNGELHDATINVYSMANGERVEGGRSYSHSKSNPWIEDLIPGKYRVVVKSVPIEGLDISKEAAFVVYAGKTTELVTEYQSGLLELGVQNEGQLVDAIIQIVDQPTGKAVAQGRTYKSANSNPKQFRLSAGIYDIKVKPVKASKAETKMITLEIKPGETTAYTFKLD